MQVLNPLNVDSGAWKVLWENPNVAENFPSQDIPIPDIERYNLFLVAVNYSSEYPTATHSNTAYVPIGGPNVIIPVYTLSNAIVNYSLRYFTVNRDKKCINAGIGYFIDTEHYETGANYSIPRYILGAHI